MNTETFDLRSLAEGGLLKADGVRVTGPPEQVRRLAANLKAMKKKARQQSRQSRKQNRR
jgi:hypothetical protein